MSNFSEQSVTRKKCAQMPKSAECAPIVALTDRVGLQLGSVVTNPQCAANRTLYDKI